MTGGILAGIDAVDCFVQADVNPKRVVGFVRQVLEHMGAVAFRRVGEPEPVFHSLAIARRATPRRNVRDVLEHAPQQQSPVSIKIDA